MKITFLIISALAFHLPLGMIKETIRKYKRMEYYNPDKAIMYNIENGTFNDNTTIVLGALGYLSGYGLALVPLFSAFEIHWLIILISNTLFLFFISQWIAFSLIPLTGIYTRKTLIKTMILYFVIGIIFLILGLIIN